MRTTIDGWRRRNRPNPRTWTSSAPSSTRAQRRGPAEWFTGEVWIDAITTGPHVRLLSVHFTPGARTAWHTHPFGQTIHVTEGAGLAQSRGGPIEPIRAGDTVLFEPDEDHWHGAGPVDVHDPPGDAGDRRRRLRRDVGRSRHGRGVRW